MRFGLVIYGTLEGRSGGYFYDRMLVEHLLAAGDRVEIVSIPWRNYPRHITDNSDQVLYERLRSLEVDVLIQDELNHPSLFLTNIRLHREAGVPIAAIVHHLRISERHPLGVRFVYRLVERAYLRSVDGFVFNSRTTQEVVTRHTGAGTPGVVAVPGRDHTRVDITHDEISRRASEPGPLRIVFVGSVTRRKGLHTLLAALDRLDPQTWELTVVGGMDVEPAYARRQRAFVRGRGWEGLLRFAGYVEAASLPVLLLRHHVLAGPSQYEGYGIAYLEALGAGLAVIASTGGAAREFIRDGENGFLVGPDGAAQLAPLLDRLHRDRTLLAQIGAAARASFESHPTWAESMTAAREFLVGLRK